MKKISLLLVLMCSLFISGCSNNTMDYASLEEYSDAVAKTRDSYKSFTIKTHLREFNHIIDSTSFIKDNKWKNVYTVTTLDFRYLMLDLLEEKQINTSLYGGGDYAAFYNNSSDFYELFPVSSVSNTSEEMVFDPFVFLSTYKFKYRMTKKNGFQCRLIKSKNADVCISDKYGIAVYTKVKGQPKNAALTINVKKIDTSDISDSEFELPKDMRLISKENFVEIEEESNYK